MFENNNPHTTLYNKKYLTLVIAITYMYTKDQYHNTSPVFYCRHFRLLETACSGVATDFFY